MILKQVSIWLELPVNSCVEEILELSTRKGGHGIPLLKTLAEQLRLSLRCSLKNSKDEDITTIWRMSTNTNQNLDAYAIQQQSKQSALDSLTAHNSEKSTSIFLLWKFKENLLLKSRNMCIKRQYWNGTRSSKLFLITYSNLQEKLYNNNCQRLPTYSDGKKQHRPPARCVGWCKRTNTSYQIVVHLQAYPDTLKDTTMFLEYW